MGCEPLRCDSFLLRNPASRSVVGYELICFPCLLRFQFSNRETESGQVLLGITGTRPPFLREKGLKGVIFRTTTCESRMELPVAGCGAYVRFIWRVLTVSQNVCHPIFA